MQRAALLLGNLAGVMTVALFSARASTWRPGSSAGLHFEAGVGGVVVLMVLALLIALAFAALGAFVGPAHGLRRGGPGRLPAVLRARLPVVERAAARADRAGLVPHDRDRQPGLVPVRGPALAGDLRLGRRGARARLRLRERRSRSSACWELPRPCGRGWCGREALRRRGGRRRLALRSTASSPTRSSSLPSLDLPAVLLHRVRGRPIERRQRAGIRLPVRLHGVPVRLRAPAGGSVRRRVHRLLDRGRLRVGLRAPAAAGGAQPARDPRRLHDRGARRAR